MSSNLTASASAGPPERRLPIVPDVLDSRRRASRRARLPWRLGRLEWRLFFVALLSLLPVALLSFEVLYKSAHEQREQLLNAEQATIRAVSTAVDTELRIAVASLETLALSPRLADNDLSGFREEAQRMLETRPGWANIVLSTPDAQQVMNLRLPVTLQPLPSHVDPEAVAATASGGLPHVGNLKHSPVLHEIAFAVQVPVQAGSARARYVLSAVLQPTLIRDLLSRQRIPEEGVVAVIDRELRIVARSVDHDALVGRPPSHSLAALLRQGAAEARGVTTTLDGLSVYTVTQRLPESGWWIAAGIPEHVIDGPIRRVFLYLSVALLLSAGLGLVVALALARTISKPMAELTEAAASVGLGERPQPPSSTLAEVQAIGDALDRAYLEREALLRSERQARQVAEDANRHKDQFLALLGHELRNPLAAMSSAAELLAQADQRQDAALSLKAKDMLRRQLANLVTLADDLLDAGRAANGKLQLDCRPLDLAMLTRQTVDQAVVSGSLRQHRLVQQFAPVWVNADPTRLEQVVGNLLSNAIKYTPAGGTIELSVAQQGLHAVLRVADSGMGMEPELLPRVFDAFVQGTRSLDRSEGGMGLGLALVQRIVALHGGTVEAISDGPGLGSTLVVQLPALAQPPEQALPALDQPPATRRKVVLVEDNADIRYAMRALLELRGHEVHEAADGRTGVELILRERPDIAFIDIGLPVLDGHAVAHEVRRRAEACPTLVALSGYPVTPEEGHGAFDTHRVKPIRVADLDALLG